MSIGTQARRESSDEELVRGFQTNGDPACFAELFVRHRRRIYLSCKGFFSDGGNAEDATQETFLRAYQNMQRFVGGEFGAWLVRIARNVCIDQWRKRRPEVAHAEIEVDELPAPDGLDHSSDLRFAVEKMRQEMQALCPEQRRCLEMKIEGYSYQETAARLRLSVEAVKSHLQNGRRMLWLKMEGTLSQLQ